MEENQTPAISPVAISRKRTRYDSVSSEESDNQLNFIVFDVPTYPQLSMVLVPMNQAHDYNAVDSNSYGDNSSESQSGYTSSSDLNEYSSHDDFDMDIDMFAEL